MGPAHDRIEPVLLRTERPPEILNCGLRQFVPHVKKLIRTNLFRVTAKGGLRLRDGPGLKHRILGLIPHGSRVFVYAPGPCSPGRWFSLSWGPLYGHVHCVYLRKVEE